ncbi:MAG: hypothetical protein IIA63_12320 [Nitrospinae bacterium]|nr:hypothetical protein [Nitrospinota bacterium]
MSATLIGWLAGGAGLILFVIWVIRRNVKFGRLEAEGERAAQYAESTGDINEMRRIQDEKDKGDFTDLDDAGDFVDSLRDDRDDR